MLLYLSKFYEYEIEYDKFDSRKTNYRIIKILDEYEAPPTKSEINDKVYRKKILEVIEKDNVQTAKNVSNIIKSDTEIVNLNHKDSTRYEYTRVRMRTMFGTKAGERGTNGLIREKIWCCLDAENHCYIPLNEEQIDNFYKIFMEYKNEAKEDLLTYYSDYINGLLTKEELNEAVGSSGLSCFISAREEFKEKYGFRPIKVPIYEISAFEYQEKKE